ASLPQVLLVRPPAPALFPYTTLFRSHHLTIPGRRAVRLAAPRRRRRAHSMGCGGSKAWHDGCVLQHRRLHEAEAPREDKMHCLRSEEHTSELQSRENLVCRLPLEKNK